MRTISLTSVILLSTLLFVNTVRAQWMQTGAPSGGNVLCFASFGTTLFAGTEYGGVSVSSNNGTSWTQTTLTNTRVACFAVSGTNLFAGSEYSGVFVSTNNGSSWTAVNGGLTNLQVRYLAIAGANLYAGTYNGEVFLSTDNGMNWTARAGLPYGMNCLSASGQTLYAAGHYHGVFASTNNGTSWYATWNEDSLQLVWSVFSLAFNEQYVFAGSSSHPMPPPHWPWRLGVYRSTDAGETWSEFNSGLPLNPSVYHLAFSGANLFAARGYPIRVFVSTDYGSSWTEVSTGLAGNEYYANSLKAHGEWLFVAKSDSTVWRRPLSDMITDVDPVTGSQLGRFSLEQNYPNPFNPSTTISYQLPTQSHVTLKIFDVLGREVATLVTAVEEPGHKSVTFDASKLSSGVYYYRLQARDHIETKTLLLLR